METWVNGFLKSKTFHKVMVALTREVWENWKQLWKHLHSPMARHFAAFLLPSQLTSTPLP